VVPVSALYGTGVKRIKNGIDVHGERLRWLYKYILLNRNGNIVKILNDNYDYASTKKYP